jgi:hypothetical protein
MASGKLRTIFSTNELEVLAKEESESKAVFFFSKISK